MISEPTWINDYNTVCKWVATMLQSAKRGADSISSTAL